MAGSRSSRARAPAMAWTEQPIHFVDFEGSVASGILEYGVVTVHHGRVAALHTRLCRATGRIRAEDTAVHGLGPDALAGCAPFAADFEAFAAWRAQGPLAAHFAGAENSLIKSVWPYGRAAPDFSRPGETTADWGPWIDTGALYRQLRPGAATLKLAELVTACGLQTELDRLAGELCPPARRSYHTAPYDALAGALLLLALAADPALAQLTLAELLVHSTLDGERRDEMRQGNLF